MHPFLKEILAVDNVRLGDQASVFVAFLGRGETRQRVRIASRSSLFTFHKSLSVVSIPFLKGIFLWNDVYSYIAREC